MLDEIIGNSPAINRLRKLLPTLAHQPTPLLIIGEGGVGKTFFAAHIHAQSPRFRLPLERINFSLLTERDQRISLFGGEVPELTSSRRSILELPTTVVLKHIDHANQYLQDKLAESLTTMQVTRMGSTIAHPVVCSVVFTLRESLSCMKSRNLFSRNLVEFLQSLKRIIIPPLRERQEDIPMLAEYFFKKFRSKAHAVDGIIQRGFDENGKIDSPLAVLIQNQLWEDNARDLKAYVRNLMVLTPEEELRQYEKLELLKMISMVDEGDEFSIPASISKIEDGIIGRALVKHTGHMMNVAQHLGLSDRAVRRRIRRN